MRIAAYISRRFQKLGRIPKSLVVMRVIAITGIAIGTATLLVTLFVVRGFEREYKRSILDFNAHIVVLKAGEIRDLKEVTDFTSALVLSEDEQDFLRRHQLMLLLWRVFDNAARWFEKLHDDASYEIEDRPDLLSFWKKFHPQNISLYLPEKWRSYAEKFSYAQRKGITGTTPFLYREGLLIAKGTIKGVVIKGVDPDTIRQVNQMLIYLPSHETLKEALNASSKEPQIILGRALARNLGLLSDEGKLSKAKVTLMAPTERNEKKFITSDVAGTFESGLYDYDSNFALMNIIEARKIFEAAQIAATGIEIKLDDPDKAKAVADEINNGLGASYQAITWEELNRELFKALSLEKLTFSIIMGILVVVAAFNIVGVLILLIYHRIHEIAVLKALGIQNKTLQKIFIRGGIATGVIGTSMGLAAGLIVSWILQKFDLIKLSPEVYFLSSLPIDFSWTICGMITIFSLFMCFVTSWIASKKLIDLPIGEALKT
jgi:lipoprotein-releasing system permease protein